MYSSLEHKAACARAVWIGMTAVRQVTSAAGLLVLVETTVEPSVHQRLNSRMSLIDIIAPATSRRCFVEDTSSVPQCIGALSSPPLFTHPSLQISAKKFRRQDPLPFSTPDGV